MSNTSIPKLLRDITTFIYFDEYDTVRAKRTIGKAGANYLLRPNSTSPAKKYVR